RRGETIGLGQGDRAGQGGRHESRRWCFPACGAGVHERRLLRRVTAEERLRAEVTRAARAIGAPADFEPILERPRDPSHGDWATTAALALAKPLRRRPADIARDLLSAVDAGTA